MITIRHWMQYSAISLEQYQQIQINGICAVGQSTLFLSACTQCSTLIGINLFQLGTPYSVYIIHWWHIPGFCPRGPFTCQTIWSQISCLGILQLSRLQAQVIDRVWQHYRQKIVSVLIQGTRDCSNQSAFSLIFWKALQTTLRFPSHSPVWSQEVLHCV